jgi:hypothetical protein
MMNWVALRAAAAGVAEERLVWLSGALGEFPETALNQREADRMVVFTPSLQAWKPPSPDLGPSM